MTKDKSCTLCNTKTRWSYLQRLLRTTLDNSISLKTDDDITGAVERFSHTIQQIACTTSTSSNSEINIEYSSAIKGKLAENRKLCKLWQTNRCPVLKNKLNRTIKALKNLLNMKRNQELQEYLSKLFLKSTTPYGKLQKD